MIVGWVLLSPVLIIAISAGLGLAIFAVCVAPVLALMSPLGVALYETVLMVFERLSLGVGSSANARPRGTYAAARRRRTSMHAP
jgi:hypothetical protein